MPLFCLIFFGVVGPFPDPQHIRSIAIPHTWMSQLAVQVGVKYIPASYMTVAKACRLLGPFALIVQAALGALAVLALVWKRHRERPQRPLKIWLSY